MCELQINQQIVMAETSPAPAIPSLAPEVYQEPPKRTKHSTPALAGILLAAGSALLFHLRQDRKRQAATSQAITELRAERDLAQKQLQVGGASSFDEFCLL